MYNENITFSIIIPIYNASKHLDKAISNYVKQSFKEFEIIYVDDNSSDDSVETIKNYQLKYSFIRLIELPKNSGAGVARNIGVSHALGEYIIFNDADDWFDENGLKLINDYLITLSFPELIIFNYLTINKSDEAKAPSLDLSSFEEKAYNGTEILTKFCDFTINPAPWNKVFSRKFWIENNFLFPEEIHHQDLAIIPYACFRASRIGILKEVLYNYIVNEAGVTNSSSDKHVSSTFLAIKFLFALFKKNETFGLWKKDLLVLALGNINYSFNLRIDKFSRSQVRTFFKLLTEFCALYDLEIKSIEQNKIALDFFSNIDKKIKELNINNIELGLEDQTYQLFILLVEKGNFRFQISDLEATNKDLTNQLSKLEAEKKWFLDTYSHLPKWFLKMGSVFRRLKK